MPNPKTSPARLKYQQISQQLVSTLRSGSYQIGDKLPSEHELVSSFSASRSTVIRALRTIEDQGLIERRQGAGSFVTHKAVQHPEARAAIGFVKNVQSGRFSDSIVEQIQSRLSLALQHRGTPLITHAIDMADDVSKVMASLADRRVAGIFMVPMPPHFPRRMNDELVSALSKNGIPVVLLDSDLRPLPHRSGFDVVGVDNRHCGYRLTSHLLAAGLKRIVFLGITPDAPAVAERRLGYTQAMHEYRIDVPAEWVRDVEADHVSAAFVADLVKECRPEAVVCKSDEFAALLMSHLPALGMQVPRDIKVVGFDDRPIASLLPVKLTTIRQPVSEIAEMALHLMDARITQPSRAASYVQLSGELIVRDSSAV